MQFSFMIKYTYSSMPLYPPIQDPLFTMGRKKKGKLKK
jgi:hypothetical protein